eukprot:350415-Chlamydomonas_euryale.AAC.9
MRHARAAVAPSHMEDPLGMKARPRLKDPLVFRVRRAWNSRHQWWSRSRIDKLFFMVELPLLRTEHAWRNRPAWGSCAA